MTKKKVMIITIVITVLALLIATIITVYFYIKKDQARKSIVLVDDLKAEFLQDVHISDFIKSIDGQIIDDVKVDTTKVGKQDIKYKFKTPDNIVIENSLEIEVVDTTPPLIWLNNIYNVNKNSEDNLLEKIMCADNYDDSPKCEILGEYDLNTVGSYALEFKATDNSGNVTNKEFTLKVNEPLSKNNNNSSMPKVVTEFKDVVESYKTDKTEIGIDVSKWQQDIDFNKLKAAGVEFVMIKVGSSKGTDGERYLDPKFMQNISGANEVGIPVGVYYYSYANTKKQAIEEAKWVLEQIKDYKVDLPIAFDWENWGSYNKYHLSFYNLTEMAKGFMDTIKKADYDTMLYSSKTYLENIWLPFNHQTWLAHYTKKTNYQKDFSFWQLCNNGSIDGISGDVDIDIRYLN